MATHEESGLDANQIHFPGLISQGDSLSRSIIVAGDLCPTGEAEALLRDGNSELVFADLMPSIIESDLAIVNLECPLTRRGTRIAKSGPRLAADPECARGIRAAGFDVVTLANNHILDMGTVGLRDTLAACQDVGLQTVGAGQDLDEATQPLFVDVAGLHTAILAFAEHEFSIAAPTSAGAWPLDLIENRKQIKRATQEADFVLVIVHGGNEYHDLPSPRLVKTCRYFVDLGANAIVCHHSHVSSGTEVYRGSPIVYGVGNLLFDWPNPRPKGWYKGYLVELRIEPAAVLEMQLIPYWQCVAQPGLQRMTSIDAEHFFSEIAALSATVSDEKALQASWEQFCQSQRFSYLSGLFSLNKLERRLLRWGLWPFLRYQHSQVGRLLNLIRCESHRDVIISLLTSELVRRSRDG